jgi:hypothetical protein
MAFTKKYFCTANSDDTTKVGSSWIDDDIRIQVTTKTGNEFSFISKENAIDLANSILEHYKNQNNE